MKNWRELPSGALLDALIAELVLGWTLDPGRLSGRPAGLHDWEHYSLPTYSSDIGAAWQVLQAMEARGWYLTLRRYAHEEPSEWGAWDACFVRTNDDLEEPLWSADTAPLAICRAALAALEVDRA